jgi:hypothetical protein
LPAIFVIHKHFGFVGALRVSVGVGNYYAN